MNHSLYPSFGAKITIPSETFGGVIRPRVRRASRLVEHEISATNPVLIFALQLSVGAAAAAAAVGTMLALFAWSGAGL
jgi:hypothetical protein